MTKYTENEIHFLQTLDSNHYNLFYKISFSNKSDSRKLSETYAWGQ